MKLILKYIKPYSTAAILAPLLMLLEVFMDLMQPTLMARIVDQGIIPSQLNVVYETGLVMLGITIIGLMGGIGCTIFSTLASTGLSRDLRLSLYKKVLTFSHKNIDNMETGSIITRLTNDVVQVETSVRMGLRIMVRAPLQVVGSLTLALIISPSLSTVFIILIPLIIIIIISVVGRSYPLFSRVQEKMDIMNIRLQENLAGVRLVKAFVSHNREKKKFETANDDFMAINMKASKIVSIAYPFMMIILNLGVVAVLWLGADRVWVQEIEIGKVIAFINYMAQLLMSMIMVSHILMNLSRAQASIVRLEEVFEQTVDIIDKAPEIEEQIILGEIEFKNVSFSYDGQWGNKVLNNISFKINKGEKIAFLGATGSGKSTIASLLPRLYKHSAGEILIDGENIKNYSLKNLRKSIGMSPQQIILFTGSIKDNIAYSNRSLEAEGDYRKYASIASIDDFIKTLPDGYKTEIKQRGVNLSGGQKQRISIARALYGDPSIIILDDSTSAVDAGTEASIQSKLNKNTNSTVILIAQRISSAIHADRIILLENGSIAGEGKHNDLLENSRIYREIFQSQTGIEDLN